MMNNSENGTRPHVYSVANTFVNFGIAVLCCLVFMCDSITCIAMSKTRRIPFATKLLTCITMFCDALFVFIIMLGLITSVISLTPPQMVSGIGVELGRICLTVSWVCVALMSLERYICLNWSYFYVSNVSNKVAGRVVGIILTVIVTIKLLVRYVFVPLREGKSLNYDMAVQDLSTNTFILAICLAITCICYISIYGIVRKHSHVYVDKALSETHTNKCWPSRNQHRGYRSTHAVRVFFLAFAMLHITVLIALVWHHISGYFPAARLMPLIFMLIMCCANPFMYAWKFMECRYIILYRIKKVCGIQQGSIETLRIEVYNIVLRESKPATLSLVGQYA